MAGIVYRDADGAYTVTSGDSTSSYTSLREALDAALPAVATHEKAARLRDEKSGDLNGAWRWLPATDVEAVAKGGVRIDATAIREMADSLNTSPRPVPIDGGPTPEGMAPSPVHGTAFDSGTPANGYAHWAVVVEGPTVDDAKLYLFAEVMPHIAREIDSGRLAEGSVHFGYSSVDGELPRGVELISHALTNDPAVKTLAPANSVRGLTLGTRTVSMVGALRARPITRTREKSMKKIAIRAGLTAIVNETAKKAGKDAEAVRGPALDKLAQLATSLGIDINDEMDSESWESPIDQAICALKNAAKVEKILEAAPAAPPASAAPAVAAASAKRTDAAPPAASAAPATETQRSPVAGLADEPAKDKFIADVLAALVNAGVIADATDAASALAAVQAMPPKSEGATDTDPTQQMGAGGSAAASAERSASVAAEQMRADIVSMKRELEELRPLREEKRARDHADHVDGEAKRRGITLTTAVRAKLLKMDKAGVDAALDLVSQPPTGMVMGDVGDTASGGTELTIRSATDACMDEAAKQAAKDEPKHLTRARAQRMARERFPAAFQGEGATSQD